MFLPLCLFIFLCLLYSPSNTSDVWIILRNHRNHFLAHWATPIPGAGNPHVSVPHNEWSVWSFTKTKQKQKQPLAPNMKQRATLSMEFCSNLFKPSAPSTLQSIFWELHMVRGLIKQKDGINMDPDTSGHSQNQRRHRYVTIILWFN